MKGRARRLGLGTAALLVALAGCASGGGSSSEGGTTVDSWVNQGTTREVVNVRNQTVRTSRDLDYPVQRVWEALRAAYDDLDFPVTTQLPAEGYLEAEAFRFRGLDDERPSRALDCGESMTGPLADQAFLTLTVMARLEAAGGGTRLVTEVQASARARDRASGNVFCRSKGRIEAALADRVLARLES